MENKNERFEYTYSAKQQEEIEKIRQKYLPKEDSAMERLHKLDEKVTRKSTMISIGIGIAGSLVFGAGISIILTASEDLFAAGIVLGVIGFLVLALAYPAYSVILERERKKYAPEILELTEQLLR